MSISDISIKSLDLVIALGVSVASAKWFDANVAIPIFNVNAGVLVAAALGSALSLAWGDPEPNRKVLFAQTFSSIFFGAIGATLLSRGFKLQWAMDMPGAFAFVMGATFRLFSNRAFKRAGKLIDEFEFPFFKKKKDDAE